MTAIVRIARPAIASTRRTGVVPRLFAMIAVYRQRRHLARLDDAALNDIGVSRDEAEREASRPFWDL